MHVAGFALRYRGWLEVRTEQLRRGAAINSTQVTYPAPSCDGVFSWDHTRVHDP